MKDNSALITQIQNGDKRARDIMVEENMGLVYSIAKRFMGRGCEREDLIQIGAIGLIKAINKFDVSLGVQFSTYAVPMIMGEIRRFLRDDGSVKVSRSLKERAAAIKHMRQKLTGELGREPDLSELARALSLSAEEIAAAENATSAAESIQRETGEGGFSLEDVLCTAGIEEGILERMALREAMAQLPERERQVIDLRYFHGLTQERIARLIGVSQVQVSRIEKKALGQLRSYF